MARDALPIPRHHPPVRQIVTGHDGTVWLLMELSLDGIDRWEIYDYSGRLQGSVHVRGYRSDRLPWSPRLRILRVTLDEMWAVSMDDLDVPYIHRFRVQRHCDR